MITILVGALLIGLTLGLLGSGGSTITVPVLVYLVGHTAKIAIAESMAIVGIISVFAAFPYIRSNQVDWKSVVYFGIPGVFGTLGGAWLGGLASDVVQLTVLGAVLLVAAVFMISQAFGNGDTKMGSADPEQPNLSIIAKTIPEGLAVGLLTGFVGVGGGFLIVPALIVMGKLSIRLAIGTSLIIIAGKSAVGFIKYQSFLVSHTLSVDWTTIAIFAFVGVIGSRVGQQLNNRLNEKALQKVFAIFLVGIGLFVLIREGSNLLNNL